MSRAVDPDSNSVSGNDEINVESRLVLFFEIELVGLKHSSEIIVEVVCYTIHICPVLEIHVNL